MKTFVTSKGTPVQIGSELGRGGEGAVFDVPGLPDQVAKLYVKEKLPNAKKQEKLRFMVANGDAKLLGYIAWPIETLHPVAGGPVVGFLMKRVANRQPIHTIYSPAHRRQERPEASWEFLLYVARNSAAAFEVLHSHGHVVGDVNQGNILAGSDSKVVLIDSDSFQVNAGGTVHLCEVAVGHFVPPELQGAALAGLERTANHDNFGLAVLIFHLLFGGRHPYSGVPRKPGVGDVLENDIKAFRYAYARDAATRGIAPPPNSISLTIVPEAVEAMFHQAFTESGAKGHRPTARQWVGALDSLRGHLRKCASAAIHVYSDHLLRCPWCALEQQGAVYFIDLGATTVRTATGFVFTQVWAMIEGVAPPPSLIIPNVESIAVKPTPLPGNIPTKITTAFFKVLAVVVGAVVFVAAPNVWLVALLIAFIGWSWAGSIGADERKRERTKREAAKNIAQAEYDRLLVRMRNEIGPEGFQSRKAQLSKLRSEYVALPQAEKAELDKLHQTAEQRQRQTFLEGFYIDQAEIANVGNARKTALRSFGIETAADVERHRIMVIHGFGPSLTQSIVEWRMKCEKKFRFDPSRAVTQADRNLVHVKFASRKTAIETELVAGAAELQRYVRMATTQANRLKEPLQAATQRLAQAKKDLSLV